MRAVLRAADADRAAVMRAFWSPKPELETRVIDLASFRARRPA